MEMTKEEALKRVELLWQEIQENEEENHFMEREIDDLVEKFDLYF